MSTLRPPFLIWMKRKLATAFQSEVVNLASSGVSTDYANQWQDEVVVRHAAEVAVRTAESNQFGLESLKQAIRHAFQIPADRLIVTTSGATGGIRLICEQLLANRSGAEVLVEAPVYEPLRALPTRFGATVVAVERRGGPASILRSVTERTVALILSNLHNPTGHWLDYDQLREICRGLDNIGSGAVVVVDETFLDVGPQPGSTAAVVHPRCVTISSLSKSHGLPALRCGWVTADPAVVPHFVEDAVLFENIGCKITEVLGALAFEQIDDLRRAARQHLDRNRALVAQWLDDMAQRELIEPQPIPTSCVVFPRVVKAGPTGAVVEQLETRFGVLVVPGAFFGDAWEDHLRIGFGGDHDALQRGLSRLGDGLVALRSQ